MKAIDVFHLHHLNDLRNLIGKEGIINIHKQLLLAILSQHIPHIDCVLHVAFHYGARIQSMLQLVKKAAKGTYHSRGFEKVENLQALLFLHLDGAQVVDIAYQIFRTSVVSTI